MRYLIILILLICDSACATDLLQNGNISATGTITATSGFVGDVTGDGTGTYSQCTLAATSTIADSGDGDTSMFCLFSGAATGSQALLTDGGCSFNGTTNQLDITTLSIGAMEVGGVTGDVPLATAEGSVQTAITTATTTDITGTSVALTTAEVLAGQTIEWTVSGNIAGTTDAKTWHLYVLDASVLNVAVAAAITGDYELSCRLYIVSETSGSGNLDAMCKLIVAGATLTYYDHDSTVAKDLTGNATVKLQFQLANAADDITSEYTKVVRIK